MLYGKFRAAGESRKHGLPPSIADENVKKLVVFMSLLTNDL